MTRSSLTVRSTRSEINNEEGECIEAALSDNMEANNSRGQCAAPPETSYDDTVPQSEQSPRSSSQVSAHVQDPLRTQEMPSYLCPEYGNVIYIY